MTAALYVLYVINCIFLILVVLLQSGRGGGLGEFGGGSGGTQVFGARGATTVMQKLTIYSAGTFFVLSIVLAILSARGGLTEGGQFVDDEPVSGAVLGGEAPGATEAPAAGQTSEPPAAEEAPEGE